jgi:hypothetical protein
MRFRTEKKFCFCSVKCNIFIVVSLRDLTAIIAIFLKEGKAQRPKMNEEISEL